MKLTRILHPEIVQGKRGDPMLINIYKRLVKSLASSTGPWKAISSFGIEAAVMKENIGHISLCKKAANGCKTYYVGKDFISALQQISSEIPIDLFPKKFFAYIAFPENTVHDHDEDEIVGCYVFFGNAKDLHMEPKYWGQQAVGMSYVVKTNKPSDFPLNGFFCDTITDSNDVQNLIQDLTPFKTQADGTILWNEGEVHSDVWRLIFNIVLYIHSPENDIFPLKTRSELNNADFQSQSKSSGVENLCTIPVTLVSWNFHRPHVFNKDSTWVRPYLRWQRCGPEFSEVKLIWVREHERTFQNFEANTGAVPGKPHESHLSLFE